MTKHRWTGTFGNYINPEKEEELRWAKTEINSKVKRILKLAKNINPGNKDGNMKKKAEIIHLIEDFHQQYESLYSLYEDLRGEVKKNVKSGDDDASSSTSTSGSESYYSPAEVKTNSLHTSSDNSKASDSDNQDLDDTILKDKLTSTTEVTKNVNFDSESTIGVPREIMKIQEEETEETTQKLSKMKDLEKEVTSLKAEIVNLYAEKKQMEGQVEFKSNEAMGLKEKISKMEARNSEFEDKLKEKEQKIVDLITQANSLQLQVNTLRLEKGELESELKKISEEASEGFRQIETLRNELKGRSLDEQGSIEEKEGLKAQVKDLELKIHSLNSNKTVLEEQISNSNEEAFQSNVAKGELHGKISELKMELETLKNDKKQLQIELEKEKQESAISKSQMEKKNTELTNKITDQQKNLLELADTMSKLKDENGQAQTKFADSKTNLALVEKKMEEMAEEFRKQFEDKYRIMSRRIRVAEQLHVENKEWYRKTKETYEEEIKDLKERLGKSEAGLKNIKDLSLTANDMLTSLDTVALKFEECTANFLNRISKASCELKFAKDWAMRKNKALLHVKDDLDCLLAQLDDKESEILVFREKVWKTENKVRELEKMVKEKEDGTLGLQEEKREAIRQLCVWIDYHRSRSDYYKKMLFEMNPGHKRAA
ncbi:hypothetical protein ACJIZ3_004164 [Penstemon smallii]|uniref:NAB domain-containing protein n=1 Tax=Penstemon smallii TaxID=265156 RepID=A0ABD3S186_9LAMI